MTTAQLVFFLAGTTVGFDLALLIHFGGRALDRRRNLPLLFCAPAIAPSCPGHKAAPDACPPQTEAARS